MKTASYSFEMEFEIGDATYNLDVTATPGYPGHFGGAPDTWAPADPHEWDVKDVARLGADGKQVRLDPKTWLDSLTDEENDRLHEQIGDELAKVDDDDGHAVDLAYERSKEPD